MNIIFLLNSPYPYYTGGRETWLYYVCEHLCQKHQIYVLSERPAKTSLLNNGRVPDIDHRIQVLPSANLNNCWFTRLLLHSYLVCVNQEISIYTMWRKLKQLLKALDSEKNYVISMDTVYTGRVGVWAKKKYKNVIFINSVRGPHADVLSARFPRLNKYFHGWEDKTLRAAHQIWSNGADTQEKLAMQHFKSVLIKNGIDSQRTEKNEDIFCDLVPTDTQYHILMIGSLLDIKGYPELIQAIAILKIKYHTVVSMTAFGKGNPIRYQKLAKNEGVLEQIHFAGHQSKTIEYAKKFDLIACLSGGGGLSMACLESLISGTPVIAWDSPVYQQMMIHLENGYLVKNGDSEALAQGIFWMMTHRKEAKNMGQIARERAKIYDWSFITQDIENNLKRL